MGRHSSYVSWFPPSSFGNTLRSSSPTADGRSHKPLFPIPALSPLNPRREFWRSPLEANVSPEAQAGNGIDRPPSHLIPHPGGGHGQARCQFFACNHLVEQGLRTGSFVLYLFSHLVCPRIHACFRLYDGSSHRPTLGFRRSLLRSGQLSVKTTGDFGRDLMCGQYALESARVEISELSSVYAGLRFQESYSRRASCAS